MAQLQLSLQDNGLGNGAALDRLQKQIETLGIERWPIGQPKINPRNARTHDQKQIALLGAAILQFGFTAPLVVDGDGILLAGHARLAAAKAIGLPEVPVIQASQLTKAHCRLFALADNRLAELAGWDDDILRLEFKELEALEIDIDLEITGFDTIDIDRIALGADATSDDPADVVPLFMPDPPVSRHGDQWLLGNHRLACADARDKAAYDTLLNGERAQMVITDPPYNVRIEGHVSGKGAIKHPEFMMASGEMSEEDFRGFLAAALSQMAAFSTDGSIHYVFMDWRHISILTAAALPHLGQPKNLIVWNKDKGGMGTFYRSKHELILVFKNGHGAHINNFKLGERGRYRTNVWDYPGVNAFSPDRAKTLAMHPTVKPVAMIADAMKDCSRRNGLVLDPFTGSGTTILAAERTKRRARCLELDPRYVDVAVKRWQDQTGETAHLAQNGRSFDAVAEARRPPLVDSMPEVVRD